MFDKPNFLETPEYKLLFRDVWNTGRRLLQRCKEGHLPSLSDFDLCYEEGVFSGIHFFYEGKSPVIENSQSWILRARMIQDFGRPYIVCIEELEHLGTFLKQICPPNMVFLDYGQKSKHVEKFLLKDGLCYGGTLCGEKDKYESFISQRNAQLLVVHGSQNILIPSNIRYILFVECDNVPFNLAKKGHLQFISRSLQLWALKENDALPILNFSPLVSITSNSNLCLDSLTKLLETFMCRPSASTEFWYEFRSFLQRFDMWTNFCNEHGMHAYYLVSDALCHFPLKNIHNKELLRELSVTHLLSVDLRTLFETTYKKLLK